MYLHFFKSNIEIEIEFNLTNLRKIGKNRDK